MQIEDKLRFNQWRRPAEPKTRQWFDHTPWEGSEFYDPNARTYTPLKDNDATKGLEIPESVLKRKQYKEDRILKLNTIMKTPAFIQVHESMNMTSAQKKAYVNYIQAMAKVIAT